MCSSHIFPWYDIILQWLNRRHVAMAIGGWVCLPETLGIQGCTGQVYHSTVTEVFFNYGFYAHMIITCVVMSSRANRCSHVHQRNTEGEIVILWLWGRGKVVWGQMKGNGCMTASGRTQKCHESGECRHSATGEDIPWLQLHSETAGPEGSDRFLQPLLAVLISLHMCRIKTGFFWNREGWNWPGEHLLIVCACLALATLALIDS